MAVQKRSIVISPTPAAGVDAVQLCKELLALRVRVDPAEVRVTPAQLRLLYLSTEATEAVEAKIREAVAAHTPPPVETPAERKARLAMEVAKGTSPNDLSAVASSYLTFRAHEMTFAFCGVALKVFEHLEAQGLIPADLLGEFPELVPYGSFKAARQAHDQLVALIAAGQFDPEA